MAVVVAAAAVAVDEAVELLEIVHSNLNYLSNFLEPVDDPKSWYDSHDQYRKLFRDYLF